METKGGEWRAREARAEQRSGVGGQKSESRSRAPEWWTVVPVGERKVIRAVVEMLRGAKRSEFREVARAAAKWERGLGCFIRVRLVNAKRRRRAVDRRWLRFGGPGDQNGRLK